ncbi:hypothetical protein BHM03_00002047 [Ensete ventricosum]|nr:hypothetical protein BHM03_00002047 [Ensete ventricosum]
MSKISRNLVPLYSWIFRPRSKTMYMFSLGWHAIQLLVPYIVSFVKEMLLVLNP